MCRRIQQIWHRELANPKLSRSLRQRERRSRKLSRAWRGWEKENPWINPQIIPETQKSLDFGAHLFLEPVEPGQQLQGAQGLLKAPHLGNSGIFQQLLPQGKGLVQGLGQSWGHTGVREELGIPKKAVG